MPVLRSKFHLGGGWGGERGEKERGRKDGYACSRSVGGLRRVPRREQIHRVQISLNRNPRRSRSSTVHGNSADQATSGLILPLPLPPPRRRREKDNTWMYEEDVRPSRRRRYARARAKLHSIAKRKGAKRLPPSFLPSHRPCEGCLNFNHDRARTSVEEEREETICTFTTAIRCNAWIVSSSTFALHRENKVRAFAEILPPPSLSLSLSLCLSLSLSGYRSRYKYE